LGDFLYALKLIYDWSSSPTTNRLRSGSASSPAFPGSSRYPSGARLQETPPDLTRH